jgi:hypothetical protein
MGQKCDLHHKAKCWQPLDIELLKTFLEVRKTRHFGKAAENLHLTQAAVSSNISQRPVGSKSKDSWPNNKNNLSKPGLEEGRDTAD